MARAFDEPPVMIMASLLVVSSAYGRVQYRQIVYVSPYLWAMDDELHREKSKKNMIKTNNSIKIHIISKEFWANFTNFPKFHQK